MTNQLSSGDTQGVRSIKLAKDDYVVDMAVITEGNQIITISENGYGKRSDESEYRTQTRGGKGVKAGNFSAKTGKLVNLKQIGENQDIMLIADSGIIIRLKAEDISLIGRDTQGVKIMRLKDGAKIVCVSVAEHEEEEESPAEDVENTLTEEQIEYAEQETEE